MANISRDLAGMAGPVGVRKTRSAQSGGYLGRSQPGGSAAEAVGGRGGSVLGQLRALVELLEANPELAGEVFQVCPVSVLAGRLCEVWVYGQRASVGTVSSGAAVQAWARALGVSTVTLRHDVSQVWLTMRSGVLVVKCGLTEEESWATVAELRLTLREVREVTVAELHECLAGVAASVARLDDGAGGS